MRGSAGSTAELSGSFLGCAYGTTLVVPEGLVGDNHTSEERSARCLVVELTENVADQSRHLGEQAPVMAEEPPKCLGYREGKLTVGELKEDLFRQMLGEKDGSFSTTGWTQIETLAGEVPKVVVTAVGIRSSYPRRTLQIGAA